jgi:Beta-lactamase enzyme family
MNPFRQPAVRAFLTAHPGMTATVHDLATRKLWSYRPGVRQITASIVKVDILETLLRHGGVLAGDQLATATGMIENSDNDEATALWNADGGAPALASYGAEAGLTGTRPNAAHWGLTTTTASDQVRLLDRLGLPNQLLTRTERDQATDLMHHVEADQQWGVGAGLPAGTHVAVKNGWLPLDDGTGWQVNSDGIVNGHGYHADISVLTTHSPTERAGIREIQGLTRLLWHAIGPTP